MNPNWQRWIMASLNTYVKNSLQSSGVELFFEGQSREQLAKFSDVIEFRWTGPSAFETTKGYWYIDVVLNFLISSTTNRDDIYTHSKVVGQVQAILKNCIFVYKYGDTDEDDQTLLGCFQLKVNGKDGILTNYFGRMQEVELEQSTIEAQYCMTGNLT